MAHPHSAPPATQIRVKRRQVLAIGTTVTFVAGTLFSGAAAAAGVHGPDMLALMFALGACTTLLLLLVWYITHLIPVQPEAPPPRSKVAPDPYDDRGTAWTQSRRPPSGSTIMWAVNVLRRRTDAASLR